VEFVSNKPSQIQTECLSLRILQHSTAVEVHEFVQRLELDFKKSKEHYLKANVTRCILRNCNPSPTRQVAFMKNVKVQKIMM
jgi:hypothetical protein